MESLTYNGNEIVFKWLRLPDKAFGMSFCDREQGRYFILINDNKAAIVQRFALGHELAHIFLGHLEKGPSERPLKAFERQANMLAWDYYRKYKAQQLINEAEVK